MKETTVSNAPAEWTRSGLEAAGFQGFVTFAALPNSSVPKAAGVYVVIAPGGAPSFLEKSPAGWVRGDPSVPIATLERKWLAAVSVVYIGSAEIGQDGKRGISKRLDEYRRHGSGELIRHWGGRYVWQLANSTNLVVCWRRTSSEEVAKEVEAALLDAFEQEFGALPFANLRRGRRKR